MNLPNPYLLAALQRIPDPASEAGRMAAHGRAHRLALRGDSIPMSAQVFAMLARLRRLGGARPATLAAAVQVR